MQSNLDKVTRSSVILLVTLGLFNNNFLYGQLNWDEDEDFGKSNRIPIWILLIFHLFYLFLYFTLIHTL